LKGIAGDPRSVLIPVLACGATGRHFDHAAQLFGFPGGAAGRLQSGGTGGCAASGNAPRSPGRLIELFERSRDAVVFISTRAQVRDFWSRNVFSVPRGTGSGFLWDDAGHVVTNYHVVEGASEAVVRLANGTDHRASLAGVSPAHDLAVLRIGAGQVLPPPLPLGSSHDLRVGQRVYAIGNPFGLDWTLTNGIVSALDRSLDNGQGLPIQHLIQADAASAPATRVGHCWTLPAACMPASTTTRWATGSS
jgi:S1-C subfamily serine protease